VQVRLLAALILSKTDQTAQYGRGAAGIYVPPTAGHPELALQLTAPLGRATDAYYQEILGTAMGALMLQSMPIWIAKQPYAASDMPTIPWEHQLVNSNMALKFPSPPWH
jgi:hypothetical protein